MRSTLNFNFKITEFEAIRVFVLEWSSVREANHTYPIREDTRGDRSTKECCGSRVEVIKRQFQLREWNLIYPTGLDLSVENVEDYNDCLL